jgi:hypothetical protein
VIKWTQCPSIDQFKSHNEGLDNLELRPLLCVWRKLLIGFGSVVPVLGVFYFPKYTFGWCVMLLLGPFWIGLAPNSFYGELKISQMSYEFEAMLPWGVCFYLLIFLAYEWCGNNLKAQSS